MASNPSAVGRWRGSYLRKGQLWQLDSVPTRPFHCLGVIFSGLIYVVGSYHGGVFSGLSKWFHRLALGPIFKSLLNSVLLFSGVLGSQWTEYMERFRHVSVFMVSCSLEDNVFGSKSWGEEASAPSLCRRLLTFHLSVLDSYKKRGGFQYVVWGQT